MFNIRKSIKDILAEFAKIEWPKNRDTLILSVMVVIISSVVGLYLSAFDIAFTTFLGRIGIL